MLERTTSVEWVNAMFRDAFSDAELDFSDAVKSPRNYALVDHESAVLFVQSYQRDTYACMVGVMKDAHGIGLGTKALTDGIAWMFANTKAKVIRSVINPRSKPALRISKRVFDTELPSFHGHLRVSCTRESFTALMTGGGDV